MRSLVPWTGTFPRTFSRLEEEMENLVSRFLGRDAITENGGPAFAPRVNVAETDEHYEVTVDLPGLKPEDVNIELREGHLWISGEKREEKEEKDKTFHRVERRYGEFRRLIPLAGGIKESDVQATYKDGVLTITLPKAEEVKPKKITIQG